MFGGDEGKMEISYEIISRAETIEFDRYGRLVDMYVFTYNVPQIGTFTVKVPKAEFTEERLKAAIAEQVRELYKTTKPGKIVI
jgi:hypothetical protein